MRRHHKRNKSENIGDSESTQMVKDFSKAESISQDIYKLFTDGSGNILKDFQQIYSMVAQMISLLGTTNIGQNNSDEQQGSILNIAGNIIPGSGLIGGILGGDMSGGGSIGKIPEINNGVIQDIPNIRNDYNNYNSLNKNLQSSNNSPNISVIVQSEVESAKAVRFLQNNFPDYQSRVNKSNF